jgi:hypothetical protein
MPPHGGFGHMRTSQADRERAVDVLKAAFAEGRLDQDEYTERVGQAHASRTYAELAALTADLPVGPLGSVLAGSSLVPVVPAGAVPAQQPATPAAASARSRPVSQLAIASLLFGIATVIYPVVPYTLLPAIVLGIAALARISTGTQRGLGLATTGIGLALLGSMAPFLGFFYYH